MNLFGLAAALAIGAACQTPQPSTTTAGVPQQAQPSQQPQQQPQRSAVQGTPALWVPNESALDWEAFLSLLKWNDNLRLTVAVSPSSLPEGLKGELTRLADDGRVEFALRLPQDPVLPLLVRLPAGDQGTVSRAQDIAQQLATARQSYRTYFGRLPKGFVPAAGALPSDLAPLTRSLGFQWVAVGGYASEPPAAPDSQTPRFQEQPPKLEPLPGGDAAGVEPSEAAESAEPAAEPAAPASPTAGTAAAEPNRPWIDSKGVVLVPFQAVQRLVPPGQDAEPAPTDVGPVVVDEAAELVSTGTLKAILSGSSSRWVSWSRPHWTTVSDAVILHSTVPATTASVPWTPDLSAWSSSPDQRGAWSLLASAAAAVERFQNSGGAQVDVLDSAEAWLRQAESGRLFLALGGTTGPDDRDAAEKRFREAVASTFKTIGADAPDALSRPLSAPLDGGQGPQASSGFVVTGASSISAVDPVGDARPPQGQTDASPYDLTNFKLEWTDSELVFTFKLNGTSAVAPLPMVDVYIDLNHRVGAGATAMLKGRTGYIRPEDAWEWAITATPQKSALFRASPRRTGPELQSELPVAFNSGRSEIVVRVPRSQLRGNPMKWGFVVVTTALDASAPEPWTPLTAAAAAAPAAKPGAVPPAPGTLLDILEPEPSQPAGQKLLSAVRPAELRTGP
jgi:hypothetical protein